MFIQIFNWAIHIYRPNQSGTERHRRWRTKALKERRCVICSHKVMRKNKWTGEWYRKCEDHRKRENQLSKTRRLQLT